MKMTKKFIILCIGALFSGGAAAAEHVTVLIQAPDGGILMTVDAEVAASAAERRTGLSNRRSLAAGHGMLFQFNPPQPGVCMWMKNTYFPLAALFAEKNNNITNIAFMAPETTRRHCSQDGVYIKYVIEITAKEGKSIPAGSRLLFP